MHSIVSRATALVIALGAIGCASPDTHTADDGDSASPATTPDAQRDPARRGPADSGDAHAAHGRADGAGERLLPIMQRLGSNMTALTHALMVEDHATVRQHAAAIAGHAPISAAEIERIHGELGADAAEFERLDVAVHGAAERLHHASEGNDPAAVAAALAEVQRGCVECHTKFRERLRTTP